MIKKHLPWSDPLFHNEAVRLYKEILVIDPRYNKALKNLGIIYLYHFQEPEKAGVYFLKYLTLVPDDPQKELILKAIQDAGS